MFFKFCPVVNSFVFEGDATVMLCDELSGLGETHTVVSHVKLGVIWANEHISQNPQGTSRDVDTQESTEALRLAHHCNL